MWRLAVSFGRKMLGGFDDEEEATRPGYTSPEDENDMLLTKGQLQRCSYAHLLRLARYMGCGELDGQAHAYVVRMIRSRVNEMRKTVDSEAVTAT